jgi:hypothetical protein
MQDYGIPDKQLEAFLSAVDLIDIKQVLILFIGSGRGP